jgi:uncharacterized membrane protein
MADGYVAGGRTRAAENGWAWIVAGWDLFKKQPGAWIGLIVVVLLINIVLAVIPVLGSLASFIFGPVFGGGILLGVRAQDQGMPLQVSHAFAGFRERFGPLVTVGVLYMVSLLAIAFVVGLGAGSGVYAVMEGASIESLPPGAIFTLLIALLFMLGLMVPVFMAVWFAPALVMLEGKDAVSAMKESFTACLRNIVPFLIYGIVMFVFSLIASIPFGLGWLVLGPVLAASIYTSYKDIFTATP